MSWLNTIYNYAKGLITFLGEIPSLVQQAMVNFPPELAAFLMVGLGLLIAFNIVKLVL